ncbi:cation:proton antiporter [Aquipuribacter sp. MA13-6]|uniref:cation:proton antiporter n=1 Tax=unclassified Aquipuribacter TaxID=2635084 RepID=UPI003EE9BD3D
MTDEVFWMVAALLAVAAAVGSLSVRLRQPLIIGFIAVGILVGPTVLGWVDATDGGGEVVLLAELGIAILLFLVGLKLDLHLIRTTGPVALATGLGQVVFTSVVGFGLGLALGLSLVAALYVAVALTFSSTIIIVKLLSDKREIDQLHGRIAVGFLIVQDIVVVVVMITLTAFGGTGEGDLATELALTAGRGLLFLAVIALAMRFVLPAVLGWLARSKELLVLFALAWGISLAAVGDWLGFSAEVGAFLGGVSLASTPYREAIGARLVSFRDFLLLFFFIDLGSRLDLTQAGDQVLPAVVLSLFVLVGNPLIVLTIMGAMGYRRRTSFLAGLTVAQISEFSLILAALGLSLGHIGNETVSLITVVGVVTISVSTYMILYSHRLLRWLSPVLGVFERDGRDAEAGLRHEPTGTEVVVLGAGRYGGRLVEELVGAGTDVLVVDADPHVLTRMDALGASTLYGDAEEPELAGSLPLASVRWVVSTIPGRDVNLALMHGLDEVGYEGRVAVTAHLDLDHDRLLEAGADLVLRPFAAAAEGDARRFTSSGT